MEFDYKTSLTAQSADKGEGKYDKISPKQKILLIKEVIYARRGIKKVSDELKLNYSTAKTLIRRFKTRGHKLNAEFILGCSRWFEIYQGEERRRCAYTHLPPAERSRLEASKGRARAVLQSDNSQEVSSEVTKEPSRPTHVAIVQQVLFTE